MKYHLTINKLSKSVEKILELIRFNKEMNLKEIYDNIVEEEQEKYIAKKEITIDKETIETSMNNLPDSFTLEEYIERIIFIKKVNEAIKQSDAGKTISNEEMKKLIAEWSK